jgi:hypothetical protein
VNARDQVAEFVPPRRQSATVPVITVIMPSVTVITVIVGVAAIRSVTVHSGPFVVVAGFVVGGHRRAP